MNKFFLLILFQISFLTKIYSQKYITFTGERIVIGKNIYISQDFANKYKIESIEQTNSFKSSNTLIPNLKLGDYTYWVKFILKNKYNNPHIILSVEYPTLNVCNFYTYNNHKLISNYQGDDNLFNKRKYKHQNYLFDIYLPQDSTGIYYLKIKSSEQIVLPLIIDTPQALAESLLINDFIWGIFVGIIVVMVLYNFFIYISVKEVSYFYYVLYSAFIGLTQTTLSGYTYRFILCNHPQLFHLSIILFPALAGIFGITFIKSFLHTKKNTPKLDMSLYIVMITYSLAIIFKLLGYEQISYRTIDFSAVIMTIITFAIAINISLQGYRPAKLFLVAFSIFFFGLLLFVFRNLGIVPYSNFTNYTIEVGIAIEVVILALALADKINLYKKEKEQSQAEALFVSEENARLIREQNVTLERNVEERTNELVITNKSLNTTLTNLKEAQLQLVEAEKMASLGQLTAGIAHEINNPINFVTSNVAPLRRDVDILIEAINDIESVGLSDITTDEKQQQIEDYKEEIDFDYLKIEIDSLLNGIHEGASRTADIVKGLKIFSRLDEDDIKKADINEGLTSTLIIANNLIGNQIQVIRNFGDIPMIECYPGKLNQVFLNIISNAVFAIQEKFGDSKGGILKITTECDDNNLFIKIEDNGTGMSEVTKNKIFEPFFTTKNVGIGTGLGMSIVYNTINKHNGQITLNSAEGVGTEFIIELQLVFKETISI